jgi:tetratricopeptide (TPR) repeat protein
MDMQKQWNASPTNLQLGLNLAANLLRLKQTGAAVSVLDSVLSATNADAGAVLAVAQAFVDLRNIPKLESALQRLTVVSPDSPEAWYDLAAIRATTGKSAEALEALERALLLSDARLAKTPTAKNLRTEAVKDSRLARIHNHPDFQNLVTPK